MKDLYLMGALKNSPEQLAPVLILRLNKDPNSHYLLKVHNPHPHEISQKFSFYEEINFRGNTTFFLLAEFPWFSHIAKEVGPSEGSTLSFTVNMQSETFSINRANPQAVYDLLKFLPTMFPGSFYAESPFAPHNHISQKFEGFKPLNSKTVASFCINNILEELYEMVECKAAIAEQLSAQLQSALQTIEQKDRIIDNLQERLARIMTESNTLPTDILAPSDQVAPPFPYSGPSSS